jgi:hypothetical protein
MEQFGASLRHHSLTWFMNYTKNQNQSKSDINNKFLSLFKFQDVAHLVAQKLKEIKQRPRESVVNMKKYLKTSSSKSHRLIAPT